MKCRQVIIYGITSNVFKASMGAEEQNDLMM